MNYTIWKINKAEIDILKEFLYEVIFIPEGEEKPNKDIIELPEFQLYIKDFGNSYGDLCLVAEVSNKIVGAVWTRIVNDYGHIDDNTPSLVISHLKDYRGQGIGSNLMKKMFILLKDEGFNNVSLSVQKANYATKMYKKLGFEVYCEKSEELIMNKKL